MVDVISPVDYWLNEYVEHFKRQVSERVVTRNFRQRDEIKADDLKRGIFTFVYEGLKPEPDEIHETILVMVVGQIELGETSANKNPLLVEQAELGMLHELKQFMSSPEGAEWHLKGVAHSHQAEVPFGWFVARCEIGPMVLAFETPEPELNAHIGFAPEIGIGNETNYTPLDEYLNG